jgi:hypothetical protein
MNYKETIKERVKILPEELKDFVLEETWRDDAKKIGNEFDLDEESYASFENEIFFVLTLFEPKSDFVENIQREPKIDAETSKLLGEDVERYIFSSVSNILNKFDKQLITNKVETSQAKNSVGSDFEQLILNQAKAMQPARATEEVGRVMDYDTRDPKGEIPQNLPIVENEPKEEPRAIHNYIGNDPYREPTE